FGASTARGSRQDIHVSFDELQKGGIRAVPPELGQPNPPLDPWAQVAHFTASSKRAPATNTSYRASRSIRSPGSIRKIDPGTRGTSIGSTRCASHSCSRCGAKTAERCGDGCSLATVHTG